MPRLHSNISICGPSDVKCVNRVNNEIHFKRNSSFACSQCLSGCFALNYNPSFSTAKIFEKDSFLLSHNLDANNVAILHIYYAASSFRSQKKEEFVGFTDFLCNDKMTNVQIFYSLFSDFFFQIHQQILVVYLAYLWDSV